MNLTDLLKKKRDGEELTAEEINFWISSLTQGQICDSQIGAMLMAMYIQGVSDCEALHLTAAMANSGEKLEWKAEWQNQLVDKHSSGGVGDKISLILAPVLAAIGLKVPMLSGRSLEHTGGTLDKLESIPGYMTDLDVDQMQKALEYAGCFISAATSRLNPADKILYAARDLTGTVTCMNLIVPSIISKKVAGGAKFLVVDVKVGKGAICKTIEVARELADGLINVSSKLGVKTRVVLSRMEEPLGKAVGNSLEVMEAVECLNGKISTDIERLVQVLGTNLMDMAFGSMEGAEELLSKVVHEGLAMEQFRKMLLVQGVNEKTCDLLIKGEPGVLPTAKYTTKFLADKAGWVSEVDAMMIGQVCQRLGAARTGNSQIDPGAGALVYKHRGQPVVVGEPWLELHHSCVELPAALVQQVTEAIVISTTLVEPLDVIIDVIQ